MRLQEGDILEEMGSQTWYRGPFVKSFDDRRDLIIHDDNGGIMLGLASNTTSESLGLALSFISPLFFSGQADAAAFIGAGEKCIECMLRWNKIWFLLSSVKK